MEAYVIWFIVAIVFTVLEMFTAGFAVLCFGIGALVAAVVSFYAGLNAQILAMVVGSFLSFILIRPMVLRFMSERSKNVAMNADALVGKRAVVSETIDPRQHTGRVAIDGDDWKAVSASGERIEKGVSVEVVKRDSIVLTVKI